jgi:hypothetical protein
MDPFGTYARRNVSPPLSVRSVSVSSSTARRRKELLELEEAEEEQKLNEEMRAIEAEARRAEAEARQTEAAAEARKAEAAAEARRAEAEAKAKDRREALAEKQKILQLKMKLKKTEMEEEDDDQSLGSQEDTDPKWEHDRETLEHHRVTFESLYGSHPQDNPQNQDAPGNPNLNSELQQHERDTEQAPNMLTVMLRVMHEQNVARDKEQRHFQAQLQGQALAQERTLQAQALTQERSLRAQALAQEKSQAQTQEVIRTLMATTQGTLQALATKEPGGSREKTTEKFLARQSTAKELPQFNGDPEDWPNFIAEFERSTKICEFSNVENISRLSKCLKGKAKETVKSLLTVPENVDRIIDTLKTNFGRPQYIIESLIEKVRKITPVKEGQWELFMDLSNAVTNTVTTIKNLEKKEYLMSPIILKELQLKLPASYQVKWMEKKTKKEEITLEDFSTWLYDEAKLVSELIPLSSFKGDKKDEDKEKKGKSTRVMAVTQEDKPETSTTSSNSSSFSSRTPPSASTKPSPTHSSMTSTTSSSTTSSSTPKANPKCPVCGEIGHRAYVCPEYKKLGVEPRWDLVKSKNLCHNCLGSGHSSRDCRWTSRCLAENCGKPHHTTLHRQNFRPKPKEPQANTDPVPTMYSKVNNDDEVLLSIIEVTVVGPSGEYSTHALLDSGAAGTFIDESVATQVGAHGPRKPLRMLGVTSKSKWDQESRAVTLEIRGTSSRELFTIHNVRTVKKLNLHSQTMNIKKLKTTWPHLQHVQVKPMTHAKPTILIGQDNLHLFIPRKIIEGDTGGPIATETKLGWLIQGNTTQAKSEGKDVRAFHVSTTNDESLHQLIKQSFSTEAFGVQVLHEPKRSREDTLALAYTDQYTHQANPIHTREVEMDNWMQEPDSEEFSKFKTGRWMTCLPWKDSASILPPSKFTALKRLKYIERKMDCAPEFGQEYCDKISQYLEKGFARKLTPEEANTEPPHTWYLPHFDVTNLNKPGKWRLVFDAASKSGGQSLNDSLLQGPDLLTPLPTILSKFRQKKIGFTGDIKDFFPRFWVRPEDSVAQRFLWRGMDRSRDPDVMELSVLTFGAVSSPFCAQDARNRNAIRFQDEFPEAVQGIITKHYIDDYLDCADTEEEALKLIHDVTTIHKKGGMQIIGWASSSREVLSQLPEESKSKDHKDLEPESSLPIARVLGLHWDPNDDVFTFTGRFNKINDDLITGNKRPTKREMLKLVMSVFDPLGFLSLFTVKAKILLQEVWRSSIGWDDELTDPLHHKWKKWLEELKDIPSLKIPRCYSPMIPDADDI